jgi:acyl-homoserine lactone acylase PvdQ
VEEQKMAMSALREGLKDIEQTYKRTEVPWGEINVVVRGGTFPLEGEGMYGVLHPDEGVEMDNGQIHCNDGWGHLLVTMEGEPKQVWSLLPYGQSEHRDSPHFNDQAKLHSERKLKRFWLTPAEILENTKSVRGDRDRLKAFIGTPLRSSATLPADSR